MPTSCGSNGPASPETLQPYEGNHEEAGGNGAAVRSPAAVTQAVHFAPDQVVDVREESGRIVIEPTQRKIWDLDELLRGIAKKNRHEAVDFGTAVGK